MALSPKGWWIKPGLSRNLVIAKRASLLLQLVLILSLYYCCDSVTHCYSGYPLYQSGKGENAQTSTCFTWPNKLFTGTANIISHYSNLYLLCILCLFIPSLNQIGISLYFFFIVVSMLFTLLNIHISCFRKLKCFIPLFDLS